MPAVEPDLLVALAVALDAARSVIALVRALPLGAAATKSGDDDLVTEVDTAVERAVRELIARRLPGHAVVGASFSRASAVGHQLLVAVVVDPWWGRCCTPCEGQGTRPWPGMAALLAALADRRRTTRSWGAGRSPWPTSPP